ncbi:ComEC/Rec2 family competence protein [Candidatus Mycobacterium wuenschmannii]|uniref:ComEC/Rec2 family competence protein n=1 Tax=Candidatus Mycobacterium wuenschmannii TaxID=3027808 RepID=A0ABY8W4Q8_9MYCO|nr:ComEC/Rec2 family competence protein [Candidatus Mycobacterium wuenschmannii]WIM89437.1 ComEC/Rec2 family competence protein [Candidatus Mycobacterium wuenschmannii]
MTQPADIAPRLDARLVPAALTSWLVTAAGILWPVGAALGSLCLAAGASGALLWRFGPRRARTVGVGVLAAGVVGAGFGCAITLRSNAVTHHPIRSAFGSSAEVAVTPTESAKPVGRGRLLFRATLRMLDGHETAGRAVVFAQARDFGAVMVGQPMRFRARVTAPTRRDLSVAVITAIGAPTMGRAGPLNRAAYAARAGFAAAAARVLPADQAAMLPALVLGDMSAVTPLTEQEFRTAGLTHLTAVSGANVTIVCGAVLFSSRLIGPRAAVGLAGVALVLFVIVVQPSASVLRAAVMGAIALVGVLSSRRRQAIPALAGTVLLLMVVAPQLAVDVGLALSVVATAALVVVAPVWSRRLVAAGWPKPLADAVCVACAAQLVTAPLIAGISGRFSVVSAVANLAVAALVAPITVLGSAAAALCLCWPAGAQLLIRFTGPELWWLLRIAHWSAGVPGASVPVPSGLSGAVIVAAAGLLTVLLWRRRWFRAGLALAACALFAWSLAGLGGPVGRT